MTNLQMWSLIVGALMPPVIALVQQPSWTSRMRSFVMLGSSILVGAGTAFFENDESFSGKSTIQAILTVVVATIATYHGFWKPTEVAPAIEKATSPEPATP